MTHTTSISQSPIGSGAAQFDPAWRFVSACGAFLELASEVGVSILPGYRFTEIFDLSEEVEQSLKERASMTLTRSDGRGRSVDFVVVKLPDKSLAVTCSDSTQKLRERQTLVGREHVLRLAAEGKAIAEIMDNLLREAETVNPGMLCSILRVCEDTHTLNHLAAPSLPQEYCEAIDGLVYGTGVGSCGTTAATGVDTIVSDIMEHPYWEPYRDLCQRNGLRSCWSTPVIDSSGKVIATFAMYSDQVRHPDKWEISFIHTTARLVGIIMQQRASEQNNRYLANHDHLTGLPNRMSFLEHLLRVMGERHYDPVYLFFLDLDHFKEVNDTLGHVVGDRLLCCIAGRLRELSQGRYFLARLGGDEFALVVQGSDEIGDEEVNETARLIISQVSAPYTIDQNVLNVGVSIGIAKAPDDGVDAPVLMRHADIAMYAAKSLGRSMVQFFQPSMGEQIETEKRLRNALEDSIINKKHLYLVFQPQLHLRTGKVMGCEVLCRWNHPELGLIPPSSFVDVAERKGLIVQLSRHILIEAIRQAKAWRAEHGLNIRMSVNASAVLFRRPYLVREILEVFELEQEDPSLYDIEITETVMMEDMDQALDIMRELKQIGMGISVDDFGTGYSSLSYIRRFPIDALKLDRSFVSDLTVNEESARLVSAVIGLAHGLGLKVVAEGTETEDQVQYLREVRCDVAQGYHYAMPMRAEDFLAWHRKWQENTAPLSQTMMGAGI